MTGPVRARVALVAGVALLAVLPPGGPLAFHWILWPALACSVAGAGLALWSGRGAATRLLALGLVVLGWYLRLHAGAGVDRLPPEPELGRWFDLSPVLGCALAGGGLLALAAGGDGRTGRRIAALGAVLLILAGLYPQTPPGTVSVPLLSSVRASIWPFLLDLALVLGGVATLWLLLRRETAAPALARRMAVGVLATIPVWLLVRFETRAAIVAAAELGAIGGAAWIVAAAPASAAPVRHRLAITAEVFTLALVAAFWWLLKIHGLGYAGMDEYIYFYAAEAWTKGIWPYRDFFFAHPPVHLVIPALLFSITGFHHVIAKLIAPVTIFLAGVVLWRAARRHFGPVAGVAAVILLWFGNEGLVASTSFTGVELTTLFLALGIAAALERRSFRAGLWFGVAVCTGIYGIAGYLTLVVLALAAPRLPGKGRLPGDRSDAARMTAGFLLVFGLVNVTFLAIGGHQYFDGVYRYHFLKAVRNPNQHGLREDPFALVYNLVVLLQTRDFLINLYMHGAHYWFALAALGVLAYRRLTGRSALGGPRTWWPETPGGTNPDGAVVLLWLSFAGTLAELASLNERFPFYFTILFPTLALIGGFVAAEVARWCVAAIDPVEVTPPPASPQAKGKGQGVPAPPPPVDSARTGWITAAIALAALTLWVPLDAWANGAAFPEEIQPMYGSAGLGEVVTFKWTPSPVLPALGELAHALVWHDTRTRGVIEPSIRHFLWTKKHTFETAPEIAAYIDAHTSVDDTITGASDYAPLIALLAHRRLAGNWVDTNDKVFTTGIEPETSYWSAVCRDRPAYLIATPASHFAPATFENRPRIFDTFRYDRTFEDPGIRHEGTFPIELWRRMRDPPAEICAP